jgi:hypothetical protein
MVAGSSSSAAEDLRIWPSRDGSNDRPPKAATSGFIIPLPFMNAGADKFFSPQRVSIQRQSKAFGAIAPHAAASVRETDVRIR